MQAKPQLVPLHVGWAFGTAGHAEQLLPQVWGLVLLAQTLPQTCCVAVQTTQVLLAEQAEPAAHFIPGQHA